jgi:quercetin dioxygenase-like cupin family protein
MSVNGYKVRVGKDKLRKQAHLNYQEGIASSFNIPKIIEDLKNDQTWLEGELNSVILLNSPTVKVLLTIIHEETEVISFQANDSITFQVIEGSLVLHIREESVVLNEGELLTLEEKIKYSFDTIEETAFLMTLVSGKED